jgi:hypothetical protein
MLTSRFPRSLPIAIVGALVIAAAGLIAQTLPPGAAGHWAFDGNGDDDAGSGLHLTLNGGPGFAPGVIGDALVLSGAQWAVRSADDAVFDFGATDFTIRAWVNFDDASAGSQFVVSKWSAPLAGWYLRYNGGGQFHFTDGQGTINFIGTGTVASGQWHHIAVRRSGTSLEMFLDCALIGSQTTAAALGDTSQALAVGVRASHMQEFMSGKVDDLAIWPFAVSNAELNGQCLSASPCDALQALATDVASAGLANGTSNSLLAKLRAAETSLCDNDPSNDHQTRGPLQAFINELSAQRGKKVPASVADALTADAQALIDSID